LCASSILETYSNKFENHQHVVGFGLVVSDFAGKIFGKIGRQKQRAKCWEKVNFEENDFERV